MGEVEKPFGCPQPGCGMSFTNEDHLIVHKRRHEILMISEHNVQTLMKQPSFIIDQTPTPTRFLRQCDEVGLFQDIGLNPFDEQFRKASQYRSSHGNNAEISNCNSTGSLETPRILPPVDSDETISSTSRDDPHHTLSSLVTPTPNISHTNIISSTYRQTNNPPSSRIISYEDMSSEPQLCSKHGNLHVNISSATESSLQSTNVISTPTPVITAGPSVTHSLSSNNISSATVIDTKFHQMTPIAAHPVTVPPSPSATVLQLLLRLPNGQAIPVEIPATPVISSICNDATSTITSSLSTARTMSPQASLAKMKLKQALASSSTAARPGNSRNSRANTADRIAEMTRTRYCSGTSSNEGDMTEDYSEGSLNAAGITRRRRSSFSDDDPIEKRKKFLERNRAAAIRCREKKKRWVQNLSCKSDELTSINQRLQSDVSNLKSEVATLKSMLLQHKDCPVTLAMHDGSLPGPEDMIPLPPGEQALSRFKKVPHHQKPRARSFSLPAISSDQSYSHDTPNPPVASITSVPPIIKTESVTSSKGLSIESTTVPIVNILPNGNILKMIPQSANITSTRLVIGSPSVSSQGGLMTNTVSSGVIEIKTNKIYDTSSTSVKMGTDMLTTSSQGAKFNVIRPESSINRKRKH